MSKKSNRSRGIAAMMFQIAVLTMFLGIGLIIISNVNTFKMDTGHEPSNTYTIRPATEAEKQKHQMDRLLEDMDRAREAKSAK